MNVWPWSTIRALRMKVESLERLLRMEQKVGAIADKQLREYRAKERTEATGLEARSFAADGSILPQSPLAEKVAKLQRRAHVYGKPMDTMIIKGHVSEAARREEEARNRLIAETRSEIYASRQGRSNDGMDSMLGALIGAALTNSSPGQQAPEEFKSGGGGDYGGGGASGSWESSSSDSGSSSSDSSSSSSDSSSSSSGSSSSD